MMVLLRDLLLQPTWSPLTNNIAATFVMIAYFRAAIELTGWLRIRFGKSSEYRQILHVIISSLVVFWPLFDTSDWSWRFNAMVPAVMFSRLVYKGAMLKDPDDDDVQNFSRSSSPSDLMQGPLQYTAVMVWLGLSRFMTEEAAIIAAALGIGDGLAPMIGSRYGRHVYRMPFSNLKTMEGSVVGVFLGTVGGGYLYLYMMGLPLLPLRTLLSYGAIAAVVEATAPGSLDNVIVTVVMHFSMDRIPQLLPEL